MRWVIIFFFCILLGATWLISHALPSTQDQTDYTHQTRIMSGSDTPIPTQQHYLPHSINIDTTYPKRYDTNIFSTGDIASWIQRLPTHNKQNSSYLIIKRLGMIVPLVYGNVSDKDFFQDNTTHHLLEQGALVHPIQEGYGVIVAGHTSDYKKNRGSYKTIFQSLVLTQSGDQIDIVYTNPKISKHTYIVQGQYIVDGKNNTVLQDISSNMLILYGCYPFGSSKQRIVVSALRQ